MLLFRFLSDTNNNVADVLGMQEHESSDGQIQSGNTGFRWTLHGEWHKPKIKNSAWGTLPSGNCNFKRRSAPLKEV